MKIKSLFSLGVTLAAALCPTHSAEAKSPLTPDVTIEIPGGKGSFDFLEIDEANHRLLASHTKDSTIDVIDLTSKTLLTRIATGTPQDVAVDAKGGKYFGSISDKKQVIVIDTKTLKITNAVQLPEELDGILFDPHARRVYATHDHGKHLWVIDADSEKLVATIDIPGTPECLAYDPVKDRIYLNIVTDNIVVVIDPKTEKVVDQWPTAPAEKPHGLALNPKSGHLFTAGANGQLVVLDTTTGKSLGSVKIAPKVDQVAIDPALGLIYSAGDGVLSVSKETKDGTVALEDIKTPTGGKNVAVDPKTHAVWITVTDKVNAYAKSWLPAKD